MYNFIKHVNHFTIEGGLPKFLTSYIINFNMIPLLFDFFGNYTYKIKSIKTVASKTAYDG